MAVYVHDMYMTLNNTFLNKNTQVRSIRRGGGRQGAGFAQQRLFLNLLTKNWINMELPPPPYIGP